MAQTKVNPSEINNVREYNNQIASQKRKLACELASSYVNKIVEDPVGSDRGITITDAASIFKQWTVGAFWCSFFVHFIGKLVDNQIKNTPLQVAIGTGIGKRAGIFSDNPMDAQPGLAISFKTKTGGHVGLVVNTTGAGKNMVIHTIEGNTTSTFDPNVVTRNGWTVERKQYNVSKLIPPKFQYYSKIWDEDNEHIGSNTITPDLNKAIETNSTITDYRDTTLGRTGTTKDQILFDWSKYMVDVSDNKFLDNNTLANSIDKPEKETKKSKNTVEYEPKQVSEASIKLDKQIIRSMMVNVSNKY